MSARAISARMDRSRSRSEAARTRGRAIVIGEIVVLELRPHVAEHVPEALATMRELVAIQHALQPAGAVSP